MRDITDRHLSESIKLAATGSEFVLRMELGGCPRVIRVPGGLVDGEVRLFGPGDPAEVPARPFRHG